jgi:hypothetical protein
MWVAIVDDGSGQQSSMGAVIVDVGSNRRGGQKSTAIVDVGSNCRCGQQSSLRQQSSIGAAMDDNHRGG